jgi:BA14K-like protein
MNFSYVICSPQRQGRFRPAQSADLTWINDRYSAAPDDVRLRTEHVSIPRDVKGAPSVAGNACRHFSPSCEHAANSIGVTINNIGQENRRSAMRKSFPKLILATAAGLVVLVANEHVSFSNSTSSLVTQADARVGRPLTPGSVAGVHRRVDRRAYRQGYYGAGYYGAGLGAAAAGAAVAGAAVAGAAAAGAAGYYGDPYGAYAMAPEGVAGDDTYVLNGNYMSGADAVAYCAQRFRSYDAASQTYLSRSGQRVSCPQ